MRRGAQFNVSLTTSPTHNNEGFSKKGSFGKDALLGYAMAAYAFLDGELDRYFDISDSAHRKLNLLKELRDNDVILLDGEQAFDFGDSGIGWTASLAEVGAEPSKKYTARIDAPSSSYIVQFNDPEFIDAFADIVRAFGTEDVDAFLRDVHEGDFEH